jgi:two-component system chemotaxis response regulator CheY
MNILIVDDNKNNRMILRLLLEDYMEENKGVEFDLDEAEDGLQAVEKCSEKEFDIVLMDIMMPNMDGIEATKIIRQNNKKAIIIAVSAVDDSDRQKLILNNGAEDYISKPVNADIFVSRISNYIKLSQGRTHTRNNKKEINLFSNNIYSRHTKFIVTSEDSLSEFWEFFLLNARKKYDNLSDIVRAIFSISDARLRLSTDTEIYVEESDELQYFTITDIDTLPPKIIELILKKNGIKQDYKIADSKVSFLLNKTFSESEDDEELFVQNKQEAVVNESSVPAVEEFKEEEIASPLQYAASVELQVFDYLEEEDLYELEEYAGKLNSIMLVVGSGGVSEDEVTDIYTYLDRIGSILSTYSEVYDISKALNGLSVDMSSHIQEFIANSDALGPMCKAFSNDMSKWIEQTFHTGAPSIDFMNDTIVVNCQTIGGMLKMDEAPAEGADDFDDIFDF